MNRMRLALTAALSTLLLAPATASALTRMQAAGAIAKSEKIAAKRWGSTAAVRIDLMTYDELNLARAKARGLTAVDRNDLAVADAAPATRVVRIAFDYPQTRAAVCATVVHEEGHLHGLRFNNPADPDHSPDPLSIMYYAPTVTPRSCMMAFPPRLVRDRRHRGWHCSPQPRTETWTCSRSRHGGFEIDVI